MHCKQAKKSWGRGGEHFVQTNRLQLLIAAYNVRSETPVAVFCLSSTPVALHGSFFLSGYFVPTYLPYLSYETWEIPWGWLGETLTHKNSPSARPDSLDWTVVTPRARRQVGRLEARRSASVH